MPLQLSPQDEFPRPEIHHASKEATSGFGVSLEDNQQALQVSLDEYQSADAPIEKEEAAYAGSSSP